MTSVARRDEDSGEYSDSQDIEHVNSTNDGGQEASDYDSAASDSEHSDQDPESQETERRVDDDEDRSNPQYIPKRGTFYEHDDRTAASGEESANTTSETASEKKEGSPTPERRRGPRKSEAIDRWSHDKYNENEQVPKSRDELVSIYGYDIRNEDAPPHARRNRRYGRGPNKYTRTWEDEEAYRRQAAAQAPRKPPNPEDFPELEAPNKHRDSRRARGPRPRSKSQPTSNESLENGNLRRNASIKSKKPEQKQPPKPPAKANNVRSSREKMPAIENLTITTTVNSSPGQAARKVNAAVAQQRPVPTDQGRRRPPAPAQQPQNAPAPNKSPPRPAPNKQQSAQQATQHVPQPAEARGGSKRYSSLRQRPLADAYAPQQTQQPQQQTPQQMPQQTPQHTPQPTQPPTQQPQQQTQPHRYHAEYAGAHQGSPGPQVLPQQLIHQVHRNANQPHGPSPPHQNLPQPHSQQVRLGILEQQQQLVPHPHHALHPLPQPHAMVAAPIQQAQGYAPPAMMPAQYMQPSSNNAVYAGAAMYAQPPPAPYPHQLYPHHNYANEHTSHLMVAAATQAGGVTYYSPAEQEPPAPPRAPRRPTAAIPIVRPDRPVNSSEKDNIDRIVENMFVRKPWPATQPGFDGSKDKSDSRNPQDTQSKESSQPNSLTSSSISTDSKPSEKERESAEPEAREEDKKSEPKEVESANQESISTDA